MCECRVLEGELHSVECFCLLGVTGDVSRLVQISPCVRPVCGGFLVTTADLAPELQEAVLTQTVCHWYDI